MLSMPVMRPVAFACILTAAAFAFVPLPSRAADIVHIGITGAVSDIPLFLAEKRGHFARQGLTADLVAFDSGAKMVAPLGAGQLEAGAGATSAGLYNALHQGIAIKIVADKATLTKDYAYKGIIVRKALLDSGQFKSLADLKGRKVAVTAPGAADNSVLNEATKKVGLTLKDVDRVYLGFAQQIVALSNGGIDASIGAEPDITIGARQGIAVMFAPIPSFYPVQTSAVILLSSQFAAKKDLAMRFTKAYLQAVREYVDSLKGGKIAGPGADTVIAALLEMTKSTDASLFREMTANWVNPDGKPDHASLANDLAYFKEQEGVDAGMTLERALDDSFVEAALKELGPYKPKVN